MTLQLCKLSSIRGRRSGCRDDFPSGFTLVELMISLLIVVLLLIGINKVFGTAAKTVEAGYSLGSELRSHRAIEAVIADDAANAVPVDMQPAISIFEVEAPSYLDKNYENRFAKWQGEQGAAAASVVPVHRCDSLSFFVQGEYRRQTGQPAGAAPGGGNQVELDSTVSSRDAWVNYGMLAIPILNPLDPTSQNQASAGQPGAMYYCPGGSPTNYGVASSIAMNDLLYSYSRNWVFGRTVTVLVPPQGGSIVDPVTGQQQAYFADDDAGTVGDLTPLVFNDCNNTGKYPTFIGNPSAYDAALNGDLYGPAAATYIRLDQNLCDLAGTSLARFRQKMMAFAQYAPSGTPMSTYIKNCASLGYGPWYIDSNSSSNSGSNFACAFPVYRLPEMGAVSSSFLGLNSIYRTAATDGTSMSGDPRNDLMQEMAQASPCLVRGATDVIIEFAGDYLDQKNNSNITATNPMAYQPDGLLDVMDFNSDKRIRWYGMPRDTKGNGTIDVTQDVVPPSWFFPLHANNTTPSFTPFENWLYGTGLNGPLNGTNTTPNGAMPCWGPSGQPLLTASDGGPTAPFSDVTSASLGTLNPAYPQPQPWCPLRSDVRYVPDTTDFPRTMAFVWGAGACQASHALNVVNGSAAASQNPFFADRPPWMIRIIIRIADPVNKNSMPQEFQYIIDLRQQ